MIMYGVEQSHHQYRRPIRITNPMNTNTHTHTKRTINNVRTDDSYYVYSLMMIMITMWKVTMPTWVLHLHFEYSKAPGLHQHQAFECHRDQHPGAPSLRKCRDSHSSLAVKKCLDISLRNDPEMSPEFPSLFSTNPGVFHVTKSRFPIWCSTHTRTKDIMNFPVSAARSSERSDPQPGLGILGKSIASSQKQGIFRHDCSNPLYVNYSHKRGKLVI